MVTFSSRDDPEPRVARYGGPVMTITTENPSGAGFAIATFDLFRDIHKGIRAELFAVTSEAGSLDPADTGARIAVSEHVGRVVDLLVSHAAHEDAAIQPAIERHF